MVKIISMFCSSHMTQWKALGVDQWLLWNPQIWFSPRLIVKVGILFVYGK